MECLLVVNVIRSVVALRLINFSFVLDTLSKEKMSNKCGICCPPDSGSYNICFIVQSSLQTSINQCLACKI